MHVLGTGQSVLHRNFAADCDLVNLVPLRRWNGEPVEEGCGFDHPRKSGFKFDSK